MKFTELRTKSKQELQQLLAEKRQRVDELRFLLRQKKTKNVKEAGALRKDIARILTAFGTEPKDRTKRYA